MWGMIAITRMALEGIQWPRIWKHGLQETPLKARLKKWRTSLTLNLLDMALKWRDGSGVGCRLFRWIDVSGAVCAFKTVRQLPVARALSAYKVNNVLVEKEQQLGWRLIILKKKTCWRTAKIHFIIDWKVLNANNSRRMLTWYGRNGGIGSRSRIWVAGTSTSGLFMRFRACWGLSIYRIWIICRQHDCGATATGLGKIWWKAISWNRAPDEGRPLRQKAARKPWATFVNDWRERVAKQEIFPVVAMNAKGDFGAASNTELVVTEYASLVPTVFVYIRRWWHDATWISDKRMAWSVFRRAHGSRWRSKNESRRLIAELERHSISTLWRFETNGRHSKYSRRSRRRRSIWQRIRHTRWSACDCAWTWISNEEYR